MKEALKLRPVVAGEMLAVEEATALVDDDFAGATDEVAARETDVVVVDEARDWVEVEAGAFVEAGAGALEEVEVVDECAGADEEPAAFRH